MMAGAESSLASSPHVEGWIVKTHNRFYQVRMEAGTFLCSPKGVFKRVKDPRYRLPVIGDRVLCELSRGKRKGVEGYIREILPRRNMLERADGDGRTTRIMAANLDRVMVVSSLAEPELDTGIIDRYILTCELAQIPYGLILNKTDLKKPGKGRPNLLQTYRDLAVPLFETCALSGAGLPRLEHALREGISFLTGTSGVGKSSLINRLVPHAELETGEVDPRMGRGRHTTTYSVLIPLEKGGYLVDSPGLRDFYPPRVPPEEVRFGFREIARVQPDCRFSSCLHDREPGCAVREAVERGEITRTRYKGYLFLLGEMRAFARDTH